MKLNPSQQRAVDLDAELIVVMSGPGSGKTRVAVERVKRLKSKSIVVLTFTNAAAKEFRSRVLSETIQATGIHAVSDVQRLEFCGTLHSYCFRLIRNFGRLLGYGHSNVALLPHSDCAELLKEVKERFGYKSISADEDKAKQVMAEYYFTLKQNNLVDYDRILIDGLALLQEPEVRAAVRIDDLIVEEAQDSAEIDWQIYAAIPATNRFIIGDVDQAIFEFREAYPAGLLNIALLDDRAHVIKLQENYRCAQTICVAANNLIRHNKSRFEKDTVSATGQGGVIHVTSFADPWEELLTLSRLATATPGSVAILCRTNFEVQRVRDYLSTKGIRLYMGDEREPRPADWRRAMLFVGFAASPFNELIAEQILKLDHDPQKVANWKLDGLTSGHYLCERLEKPDLSSGILRYIAEQGISRYTVGLVEARWRLMPDDATLSDLLHDLYSEAAPRKPPTEGAIFLGTIHSAKGREFDVVFLPAFEESKLNDQNIEEERRLAFVAITRARSVLHISWAERRKVKWGDTLECSPSRFIAEMGL